MTNDMHIWNEEQYPNAAQTAARAVDAACAAVPITLMDKIFEGIENAANNGRRSREYTCKDEYSERQNEAVVTVLRHLGYDASVIRYPDDDTMTLFVNWESEVAGR